METTPALAGLVRRLRDDVGLTQEELAERAGISVRTVSDIERGLRRSIYRDTAERLADALEVEEEDRPEFVALARKRVGRTSSNSPSVFAEQIHPLFAAVPPQRTRLIGRERELGLLIKAFGDRSIRLHTLTGPGGIGKTRVAAEAATRSQGMFRDGVFFLSLGSVDQPDRVIPLIARTLGLATAENASVADISGHLEAAEILVVLDTFEHLLQAAVALSVLMAECPGVTLLITSRESLHLRDENVIPVPPLELPEAGLADVSSVASSALFLDRARAIRPDLRLDATASRLVVEICRRLNGLPLAIELAASRIQHLPLVALRDQLDSRLNVLTRGPVDLPARQRTMRHTIAWSYDLLSSAERSLFRALSVFAGGWLLASADDVWASVSPDRDTLASMSALVDKSLVVLTEADGPEPRYGMLDIIGEYAMEQREEYEESQILRRAHALSFLSLAETAELELGGSAQEAWYRRLLMENENLRNALRWAASHGEPELGVRLAGALWQFWRAQGSYAEGRTWLNQTLEAAPQAGLEYRAKAIWGAAWLAFHQDDLPAAEECSRQLLEATDENDQTIIRRNALTVKAMLHIAQGQFEAALSPLRSSVLICEELGPSWHLATSRLNLALALMRAGQVKDAERLLQGAFDLYQSLGDERFATRSLVYRAHLDLLEGETMEARKLFTEGVRAFVDLEDQVGIAESLEGLAAVNAADLKMEAAALLWGVASRLRESSTSTTLRFERALIDHWLDDAKDSLGDDKWHVALANGETLDLEAAMRRA
ncbi:MAG: helix-turn-helix domain-containing protein [Actinomycetota bacterium]|nr:helix-turn-helix domain-containing protein [Actinomycetota bacterium]